MTSSQSSPSFLVTSSPMDLSQLAVPCRQTYSTHQAAYIDIIITDIIQKERINHFHLLHRFFLPVHINLVDLLKVCRHGLVFHCHLYTGNQFIGWNRPCQYSRFPPADLGTCHVIPDKRDGISVPHCSKQVWLLIIATQIILRPVIAQSHHDSTLTAFRQ